MHFFLILKYCAAVLLLCIQQFQLFSDIGVWIGESDINSNKTFPRLSSCDVEDILTCNINITDTNIRQLFRWYKDDIPISSCTSYMCRIAFTKASLKWDRYAYAAETRQGSYHCEVTFYGLTKTYKSPATNIFFSGKFIMFYNIYSIKNNSKLFTHIKSF